MRGSVEQTASLAVAKTRCRGGQTRWPWRAEWPWKGYRPKRRPAEGSVLFRTIMWLYSASVALGSTLHLALAIFQQGIPCFGHDQWPKSDIVGAFVAKIGYPSISVFTTPPGRHLIGQRRPPPDDGHISAAKTRFWLLNFQKVPDNYPTTQQWPGCSTTSPQRPTTHHLSSNRIHPSVGM